MKVGEFIRQVWCESSAVFLPCWPLDWTCAKIGGGRDERKLSRKPKLKLPKISKEKNGRKKWNRGVVDAVSIGVGIVVEVGMIVVEVEMIAVRAVVPSAVVISEVVKLSFNLINTEDNLRRVQTTVGDRDLLPRR